MYIVRIASESAPVLVKYRSIPVSEKCREKGHTQRAKCCKSNVTDSLESSVENTSELRVLALCKLRTLRVRTRAFGPRLGKSQLWYLWNYLFYNTYTSYVVDNILFGNERTRLHKRKCWNHVSGIILKFDYFLVVNNSNYLSHVVDDIIFGISVPSYPCITVESEFLGQFQLTFQMGVP